MKEANRKVRLPFYPLQSRVRAFLGVVDGIPQADLSGLSRTIKNLTGTPQSQVDWSDPDAWIRERLRGPDAELAARIWTGTEHCVNPRHLTGVVLVANHYGLVKVDGEGVYRLTDAGRAFARGDLEQVRRIDDSEGLLEVLRLVAEKVRPKTSDLVSNWTDFLQAQHSTFTAPIMFRDTLRRRLRDLVDRGLVARDAQAYVLTPAGMSYLGDRPVSARSKVIQQIIAFNEGERRRLRDRLARMHPYRFEYLVGTLLERIGYEDVEVTKQSGDKGVDVIATIQMGITRVTEVVQVKRHQANIPRQTLDQLRGVLPFHKAIRGTIITLGGFAKGCTEAATHPGAAPITLIDGERLLSLLIENGLGVRSEPQPVYELDEAFFEDSGEPEVDGE